MTRRWSLPPGWPHAPAPHAGLLVGLLLAALLLLILTLLGVLP